MSADSGRQIQGDQGSTDPVARGRCQACNGSGIKDIITCPKCDGTGDVRLAALGRAYRLGVGDGMAAMRNASPSELDLQRDVRALIEELKWWQ